MELESSHCSSGTILAGVSMRKLYSKNLLSGYLFTGVWALLGNHSFGTGRICSKIPAPPQSVPTEATEDHFATQESTLIPVQKGKPLWLQYPPNLMCILTCIVEETGAWSKIHKLQF